jgi:hypothetical protein
LDHRTYRDVIDIVGKNVEKSGKISRVAFIKKGLSSAPIFTILAAAKLHYTGIF